MTNRGKHFTALATLPLNDPEASVAEFERTVRMGFKGCMVFGNVNGTALADRRFWPLWEHASESRAIMYIHPTFPLGVEAMQEYWLMPLVGFLFDTTLAAAHLVFAGVTERYPGIRWVLGHLGGTIPYLAERLDRGFEMFAECRKDLTRPPSEHLKGFYYDTVNFDRDALRLAIAFAGVDQLAAIIPTRSAAFLGCSRASARSASSRRTRRRSWGGMQRGCCSSRLTLATPAPRQQNWTRRSVSFSNHP